MKELLAWLAIESLRAGSTSCTCTPRAAAEGRAPQPADRPARNRGGQHQMVTSLVDGEQQALLSQSPPTKGPDGMSWAR
jgi:hypothetical protein